MYDLIIKNALIYDGTGEKPFSGDVAVTDGKIAAIGTVNADAKNVVDAKGLCLAPGFIDAHAHSDIALHRDPQRLHVLRMGVTTEISGQCGHSVSPITSSMSKQTQDYVAGVNVPVYSSLEEHIAYLDTCELGTNQIFFAGHGALRGNVLQLENKDASEEDIKTMQEELKMAVKQGALGISTGLSYVPGIYSNTHELTELGRAAGEAGGVYTTHSRSESMGLFDSVSECIHISKEGKVPVNISHFKCVGKPFWKRCEEALAMIDQANEEGADVMLDCYPYVAASTTTLSAMPPKFLDEGAIAFAKKLEDPAVVEEIRKEIYEINDPGWDNSLYYVGAENFLVVRAEETPWAIGKTYAQIGEELGMDPFDAIMYMLKANHGTVYECRFSMCEENVEAILKHPKCMVGSDGIYNLGEASAHPRAFGSFPRYLGYYIRQRKILSREEGIHRITGMTADRYGLKGKGNIKVGYDADLVLFDYETIIDHADFLDPFKPNEGIHQVYIDGKLVLQDNEPTGIWAGKYLR